MARYASAYHEAGHAVVGVLLRWAIRDVSIVPDEQTIGRVRHPRRSELDYWLSEEVKSQKVSARSLRERVALPARELTAAQIRMRHRRARIDIAVRLAGRKAEERFTGKWTEHDGGSDRFEVEVAPAGDRGVSWGTLQWTFKDSLYELGTYIWDAKPAPKVAFTSLLVNGATPDGIIGLPEGFVANQVNSFEEETLRLGPLVLKAEEAGTRQFQPMFNLLFQCAGLRNAPDILHL
jgi:hypothetical protein